MPDSMTAFATRRGQAHDHAWTWEMRSVNGKGLDLRLRVPDWVPGLEPAVRTAVQGRLGRGNVTVGLKLSHEPGAGAAALDAGALEAALAMVRHVEAAAAEHNLRLAPPTAADILALPGVTGAVLPETDVAALRAALIANFEGLLDEFAAMRATEGNALEAVLRDHLAEIAELVEAAAEAAEARRDQWAESLRMNLARVLDNSEGSDAARVAQELALIAVKSDVREELERLAAHVAAARALLDGAGPIGRKLDFLMQEFNREANTLCSKAQSTTLTGIGLDLKHVIDQMREQVQNVE
ncbi:TIGR00255 family protein [Rhodovulum sp. ES.010]|uniref:YicC/YloC family endoribonuclease n=1 Tax=Rhodovulum sp. ES.010 TaxID=1882821 RepID=UPI00092BFA98|nr:YicC/YloC family endoribonuclease [Rhodovulum sp. ES.010]SIO19675.1 TIGR00255 family protein [Rhodovulum sp. ES.010]